MGWGREWMLMKQQIPFGDDNKKGKCNGKDNNRSPSGMTTRKASATAKTTADPLWG
jgi:hypothetical protein